MPSRDQDSEREKSGKIPQRKTLLLIKGRVNYPRATRRMKIEILPFIDRHVKRDLLVFDYFVVLVVFASYFLPLFIPGNVNPI